jgi:hypothetical protein
LFASLDGGEAFVMIWSHKPVSEQESFNHEEEASSSFFVCSTDCAGVFRADTATAVDSILGPNYSK